MNHKSVRPARCLSVQFAPMCVGLFLCFASFGISQAQESSPISATAQAEIKKGNNAPAIAELSVIIERQPKNISILVLRGRLKLAAKDTDGAIADCSKAIEAMPDRAFRAYMTRGEAYGAKSDMAKSMADFDKASQVNPQVAADVSALRKRVLDKEVARLTAITFNPDNASLLVLDAYIKRADAYLYKGDTTKALGDHDTAKAMADNIDILFEEQIWLAYDAKVRMLRARIFEKQGDWKTAGNIYWFFNNEPQFDYDDTVLAEANLAWGKNLLAKTPPENEEAEKKFAESARYSTQFKGEAAYFQGLLLLKKEDYTGAQTAFEVAVKANYQPAVAQLKKAQELAKGGNTKKE